VAFQRGKKCLISWRFTPLDVENEKYPEDSHSHPKEADVMAAQIQAGAFVIVIVLVIVLAGVTVSILPISPSITINFQVQNQQPPYIGTYQATIILGSVQYQKIPFTAYYASQRDTLVLSQLTGQTGSYKLGASVSYAGVVLTEGNYTVLGEGFYQLKIDYYPRTESANTPYVVNLVLYLQYTGSYSLTISVVPS
jgi:hypothetical protein